MLDKLPVGRGEIGHELRCGCQGRIFVARALCLDPSDAGQVVRLRGRAHGGQPQRRNREQERAGDHNGLGDAWPGGGGASLDGGRRGGLIALDGDPQPRLSDRQIDRRLQRAAIAIRDDILTDADFSADRVKVDGAASDPQDGMLSRDAGVPQDDVGARRGADTDIARFELEAHAAMKAGRALEHERRRRRRDGGGEPIREGRNHPGHFGPQFILRLDVHNVDPRRRKNCERRHKGPSSPESGLDIGAADRGRSMGALGSAPCRQLPRGAAASPALFCLGAVAEVQMG